MGEELPTGLSPVPVRNDFSLAVVALIFSAFLAGTLFGYFFYPFINKPAVIPSLKVTAALPTGAVQPSVTPADKAPFCKNYGTYTIPKNELLETYTTGPGDTLRDVAKNKLSDESRALELVDANPQLNRYEVDDILPMRLKIFIPNDKFSAPDITAYIKTSGNISFNKDKPMFGVNAPNSGTGPFIITDTVKKDLEGIKNDDCVVVVYGSRGFDPQKVVMEVTKQE